MRSEGKRYRLFSRRAALLAGAKGVAVTVLAGRMYYLGVVESGQYKVLADDNRISLRLLAPERGEILDRQGEPLVTNRRDYRVFLIPEQASDVVETLTALGRIIDLTDQDIARIERQIRRQRRFLPVTVAENLDWDSFARINVSSPDLPGIQPDAGMTRYYPYGTEMSQVVGYVGAISPDEVGDDPLMSLPGFKTGKQGIERAFEQNLRGVAGTTQVEVNAFGRVIRELAREDGARGNDVVLTLDMELPRFAAQRLGEESAAAIIMDIDSGDVLAHASTPSYDPNDFNLGISRENWQALLKDPRKPLINKCLTGQYPPGSTFKMVVALAGLEAGVIDPDEEVACWGKRKLGNHLFHCWRKNGHGKLALVDAIARSCDVYFYEMAERVGIDRIGEMAARFGFGQTFDIDLPGESPGLIPGRDWKLGATGEPWQVGETLVVGIGQGALLATQLQLAVMTARLASGRAVRPRLIHAVGEALHRPVEPFDDMGFDPAHLALIRRGMEKVMEDRGTAVLSRLRGEGRSMAGKTGTAQVRRISKAERERGLRKTHEKPWAERHHALFVAYGPIEQPRYAISVLVEHGDSGSKAAAPIARDLMAKTLELDPARQPPLSPDRVAARRTNRG